MTLYETEIEQIVEVKRKKERAGIALAVAQSRGSEVCN
jgi:hypothetical protein